MLFVKLDLNSAKIIYKIFYETVLESALCVCPQPSPSSGWQYLYGAWYYRTTTPRTFLGLTDVCRNLLQAQTAIIYEKNTHDAIKNIAGK